jgi:putative ABC transport system permease protein
MLKNILKATLRKLKKDLGYTLLIILGLSIGITSSLFLLLYVFDDLSFDKFFEHRDRMVRVVSHITESDDEFTWLSTQLPLGPQMYEDYPDVEQFVRVRPIGKTLFEYNDTRMYDVDVVSVDSSFFSVFTYPLLVGNPLTVLKEPNSMVVTESFATRFFGGEDPFGKSIRAGDMTYEVRGVMKDVPHNTHLPFSALVPIGGNLRMYEKNPISWGSFNISTYLLLREGTDIQAFQDKVQEMYEKYAAQALEESNWQVEYELEPVTDIYLKSEAGTYSGRSSDMKFVYIFSIVAFFMLLVASINYMNLATTRSFERAHEVGMRRIAGSQRGPLIAQFLCESLILTLVALVASLVIIILLFPAFNQFTGKIFDIHYLMNARIVVTLVAIVFLVGLLGGSYPAIYLSRFDPVSVTKGEMGTGRSGFLARKVLVVLQFSISVALMINTWLIYKQLHFLMNKDPGFRPENVVILSFDDDAMPQKYPVLREALRKNPDIISISGSNSEIGHGTMKWIMEVETPEGTQEKGINMFGCDYDFIRTMGIEIVTGRDFSPDFQTDTSTALIINEAMAARFSWDQPLGKKMDNKWRRQAGMPPFYVVGVVKNFYQTGLYEPVDALALALYEENYLVNIRISSRHIQETLDFIEASWSEVFPDRPFAYSFLEDDFHEQFRTDQKRGTIFLCFSLLLILISCLGIIGLASFTVERRTREIGIRKALGASVRRIVILFGREFLILVGISLVPAYVFSYFYLKHWLQDYTYPASLDAWMFVGTGLFAVLVTLVSMSVSALRAGETNPAESLRAE